MVIPLCPHLIYQRNEASHHQPSPCQPQCQADTPAKCQPLLPPLTPLMLLHTPHIYGMTPLDAIIIIMAMGGTIMNQTVAIQTCRQAPRPVPKILTVRTMITMVMGEMEVMTAQYTQLPLPVALHLMTCLLMLEDVEVFASTTIANLRQLKAKLNVCDASKLLTHSYYRSKPKRKNITSKVILVMSSSLDRMYFVLGGFD